VTCAISATSRRELSPIFFLQGHSEQAPFYTTVKNWAAEFKRVNFSTCNALCPGRPEKLITPEIIDHIRALMLEDSRISVKSIAQHLGISCERVGSISHEDLDNRKFSA
jgi:hypothetical protein